MSAHEAGRELDALVAERVMGFELVRYDEDGWPPMLVRDGKTDFAAEYEIPYYSIDIAAAWQVVEKMRTDRWRVDIFTIEGLIGWRARFSNNDSLHTENADSAPLAICRVALATLDGEGGE